MRLGVWGVLGAMALVFAAPRAGAQEPGATPAASADPFEQVLAAKAVAEYGRRHHDAFALLTAARMLDEVPIRPAGAAPAGPAAAFSPDGLLAEAREIASPEMQSRLTLGGTRGVFQSPFGAGLVRAVHDVAARGAYVFAIRVKAGEPLRIGAIGDVGRNMSIRLLGAKGEVLCLDDRGDYAPVCLLHPAQPAELKVEIANRSASATRAVILSN